MTNDKWGKDDKEEAKGKITGLASGMTLTLHRLGLLGELKQPYSSSQFVTFHTAIMKYWLEQNEA